MARRQRNRVIYDAARLDAIVSGQRRRTCMDVSSKGYLCKMKVMTEILNEMDFVIRDEAFELNEDRTAKMHTGEAAKICMLRLPISLNTAKRLFAAISVDETLPKRKKRVIYVEEEEEEEEEEEIEQGVEIIDDTNPGATLETVCM